MRSMSVAPLAGSAPVSENITVPFDVVHGALPRRLAVRSDDRCHAISGSPEAVPDAFDDLGMPRKTDDRLPFVSFQAIGNNSGHFRRFDASNQPAQARDVRLNGA